MNSIIISLLYKASPDDVKLIMVDPKLVELGVYNGIPHFLIPVVTDPKKGYIIIHKCDKCGEIRRNRAANEAKVQPDDINLLIKLTSGSF